MCAEEKSQTKTFIDQGFNSIEFEGIKHADILIYLLRMKVMQEDIKANDVISKSTKNNNIDVELFCENTNIFIDSTKMFIKRYDSLCCDDVYFQRLKEDIEALKKKIKVIEAT